MHLKIRLMCCRNEMVTEEELPALMETGLYFREGEDSDCPICGMPGYVWQLLETKKETTESIPETSGITHGQECVEPYTNTPAKEDTSDIRPDQVKTDPILTAGAGIPELGVRTDAKEPSEGDSGDVELTRGQKAWNTRRANKARRAREAMEAKEITTSDGVGKDNEIEGAGLQ